MVSTRNRHAFFAKNEHVGGRSPVTNDVGDRTPPKIEIYFSDQRLSDETAFCFEPSGRLRKL
jgi:hypothetical protein